MQQFILFSLFIIPITLMAQPQQSFTYTLALREVHKDRNLWTEGQKSTHQAHLAYLDSLTQAGKIEMGGIFEQGLQGHLGFVILKENNYQKAHNIVRNDPYVKNGMAEAKILSTHVYFRGLGSAPKE